MATHSSAALRRRRLLSAVTGAVVATLLVVPPAQAETVNVEVAGLTFPATVPAGMTGGEPSVPAPHAHVVWTVTDPTNQHTITFDDPALVSSGPLLAGQRHESVIYTPGTVAYRCTIHPEMTGTVVVTPPKAVPVTAPSNARPSSEDGKEESGRVAALLVIALVGGAAGLGWFIVRRRSAGGA